MSTPKAMNWRPISELSGPARTVLVAASDSLTHCRHYRPDAGKRQQNGFRPTHFCEVPPGGPNDAAPPSPPIASEFRHRDADCPLCGSVNTECGCEPGARNDSEEDSSPYAANISDSEEGRPSVAGHRGEDRNLPTPAVPGELPTIYYAEDSGGGITLTTDIENITKTEDPEYPRVRIVAYPPPRQVDWAKVTSVILDELWLCINTGRTAIPATADSSVIFKATIDGAMMRILAALKGAV